MAPGGVEPPHTDSKSVALSAELRGRGLGSVDGIWKRSACLRGLQVVDENAGHRLARFRRRATDWGVRTTFGSSKQLGGHVRFVGEDVEARPDPARGELRDERLFVDERSARGVDEARAVVQEPEPPRVEQQLRLVRQRDVDGDDVRLPQQVVQVAILEPELVLLGRGSGARASCRAGASRSRVPCAPRPCRSARGRRCRASRPVTSWARSVVEAQSVPHLPARTKASDSTTRRRVARMSASARSASQRRGRPGCS